MPSLVQHTKAAFNATSSWAITYGSNVTTNNRITVQLANATGTTLSGVSDNAAGGTNTYNLDDTKDDATVGGQSNAESANITRGGGSALTVTASFTANQSGEGYLQEFSGLDTATNIVRTKGENVDTVGSTAHSATTAAASVSGDLVLGMDNGGAVETSIAAANSTTLIDSDLNSASAVVWKSATGATETAGTTVAPSDTYIFMTVVLKQAAAAVVGVVPQTVRLKLRALFKARGRVFERFWPQQPTPGPVRFILDRRLRRYPMPVPHGRRAEPFWPQQAVAAPPPLPPDTRPPRRRLLALRRRPPSEAPRLPTVQPLSQVQKARSKFLAIRRARTDLPLTPVPTLPPAQQSRRRLAVYRRGRVAEPFWPQQAVPGPVRFILDRRLRRYPMPVPHGRRAEPFWPQAVQPAAGPKLPSPIASGIQQAIASPKSGPMATPGQVSVAQPKPGAIATPVPPPKIIN